jgi:hypothetical protein
MGGTYFLPNEAGRKVAILKPCDEEPLAPHNPKGYVGRALGDPGWKPTVRVGEVGAGVLLWLLRLRLRLLLLLLLCFLALLCCSAVQAFHPVVCT